MSDARRDQIEDWLQNQEIEAPIFDDCDAAILGLSLHAPGRPPTVVYSLERLIAVLIGQGLTREEALEHIERQHGRRLDRRRDADHRPRGRTVKERRSLDLVPTRGECHHISGRVVKAIRWDVRNGLLLCATCHERLTGKVAEKHVLESRQTFTVDGVAYLNGSKPVKFTRVA